MRLEKEDNTRLILLIAFSLVFLTAWNAFFPPISQKEALKEGTKIAKSEKEIFFREKNINIEQKEDVESHILENKNFSFKASISSNKLIIKDILYKEPKQNKLFLENDKIVFGFNNNNDIQNEDFNWSKSISENSNLIVFTGKNNNATIIFNIQKNDEDDRIFIKTKLENKKNIKDKIVFYSYFENSMKDFSEFVIYDQDSIKKLSKKDSQKKNEIKKADWFGLGSKYFSILLKSEFEFIDNEICEIGDKNCNLITKKETNRFGLFYKGNFSLDQSSISLFILPNSTSTLKDYSIKYDLKKLENLVDLGFFFFISKPILILMNIFYNIFQNYAIAIILITIIFKIITIPLINKSYSSMNKIKAITPELEILKERLKEDKTAIQVATVELYKKHGVNPLASIIPMLIQIPIFFALYKVFSGCFELYGANGFLWVKDLSEPENLSFLNLFGLINFSVPSFLNLFGLINFSVPSFLRIGPMSILMGLTMWLQQKTSPSNKKKGERKTEMEEAQDMAMKIMPLFLTFVSSSFPSGLLLYWIFSNSITSLHQIWYNKFRS